MDAAAAANSLRLFFIFLLPTLALYDVEEAVEYLLFFFFLFFFVLYLIQWLQDSIGETLGEACNFKFASTRTKALGSEERTSFFQVATCIPVFLFEILLYLNTEKEGEHSMMTFPMLPVARMDLGWARRDEGAARESS